MPKEKKKVTLKVLRATRGKKQGDIAESLNALGRNIDQAMISRIESGSQTPSLDVCADLARAYEVNIIEMLLALDIDLTGVLPPGYDHSQN